MSQGAPLVKLLLSQVACCATGAPVLILPGESGILRHLLPVLLIAAPLAGCGADAQKPKPPVVVGVITAKAEAVPLETELSGRTEASLVAEVRPQVSGIVTDRLFAEGGWEIGRAHV